MGLSLSRVGWGGCDGSSPLVGESGSQVLLVQFQYGRRLRHRTVCCLYGTRAWPSALGVE